MRNLIKASQIYFKTSYPVAAGVHQTSYLMGTGGSFRGDKAAGT
jgi:hypothetical protein